jgi:hypothetical protein
MRSEIADIATNEAKLLKGFKVLGVFPFYLKYIRVSTHVKLCKIREKISVYKGTGKEEDFYNADLQAKIMPLVQDYCLTALLNDRPFKFLFRRFLNKKLNQCGHYHIFSLFLTIQKLDEPAFFLAYWNLITRKDNTLLKADEPS